MDERMIARQVLQSMQATTQHHLMHHVRLINLAVYDERIDPNVLLQEFNAQSVGTLAQGARLRMRIIKRDPLVDWAPFMASEPGCDAVRVDSIEMG